MGLLRAWHEETKHNHTWKALGLILAHSTEVYIPITISLSIDEIEELMKMVGGHPYGNQPRGNRLKLPIKLDK